MRRRSLGGAAQRLPIWSLRRMGSPSIVGGARAATYAPSSDDDDLQRKSLTAFVASFVNPVPADERDVRRTALDDAPTAERHR